MNRTAISLRRGFSAWRRHLGVRIVAILFAITVLAAAIECFVESRATERAMLEELQAKGRLLARNAALSLLEFTIPPAKQREIEAYTEGLVRQEPGVVFASVLRGDGVVLGRYPRDPSQEPPSQEVLYQAEPIRTDAAAEPLAHIHLGLSLAPMRAQVRERVRRLLLRAAVSATVVGLAMWLVLRRVVVRPLRLLDREAQRLGRGELGEPLPDFGATEIGRLGYTLDEMRRNLAASHAAVAEQNKRLRDLDRMKSEFLANMSHEMRTPLTSILGEAEILGEATALDGEATVSARAIERNGACLLELVDRMLDLAKLESGNLLVTKKPCRPAEVIGTACERFEEGVHRKGIELRVDVEGLRGVSLQTDPTRLAQMVTNIVGNAVKFTASGAVSVAGSLRHAGTHYELSIVVTDTGVGIPAEFLLRGIEAFRQADGSMTRQFGGSGLGLYATQQIARRLGGDLRIESEPGRGTTVEIRIAVELCEQPAERKASPPANGPGRVLVVDDARDNQHLLKVMLQKLGHRVELADNGRIGVEMVKSATSCEPFDLILMDLQMPELDGIGAIRELRAGGCSLPIVALTAHAQADDRERCLAAGANAYETKPITRQRLAAVVAAYLTPAAPRLAPAATRASAPGTTDAVVAATTAANAT